MAEPEKTERPKYEMMALAAKSAFLQVCDEKKWSTEIMFAMQILRGNELLQKANPDSIKNAVVNIALTGATLNPAMAMAYLVPRSIKGKGMCCCLDFSYRGLIKIATDSGSVKHIASRLVYTFDEFDYSEIDGETHIKHKPSLKPPVEFTAGPSKFWDYLLCGYLVATLYDGTKIIYPPLLNWKLKKAMETSMTSKEGTPWRTHPDEMCLKTIVKYGYKTLPQSDRMSEAVQVLNEHEGMDLDAQKRSRASDIMSRFADAEDAEIVSADESTGEIKEPGPSLCPTCQKLLVNSQCHNPSCPDAEPPSEELFGKR